MEKKTTRFPRIYFGWWTALAGGILALWGYGYQAYGISALFKPISSELGFSRTATSVAASIGRFEGGFEAPLVGWMTDRFGPRWIVFCGVFFISVALVLMYFVNSLWTYYLVWGALLGFSVNIALSIPIDAAISNWFVKKRGVALSIKWAFSGLSGVVALPLIAWLINVQGWRMTCVTGGLVMAVIGLPLAWFFLKQRRPEYYGLLPDGAKTVEDGVADVDQMIERGARYAAEVQEVEFTVKQVFRTRVYWLLIAVNSVNALISPAISIHTIPFLTDLGIAPLVAAGMMSVMIGTSVPARLLGGMVADRLPTNRLRFLLAGAYLLELTGMGIFLLTRTVASIYVWYVLWGLGMGTAYIMNPVLRARYFGRKAYGSIHGFNSLILMPVGVVAPIYAGWVYDSTGSYISAFTSFVALLAVAIFLVMFARPPRPPEVITDIRRIM
ncbi:MAG: MFS transporter [Chloroflexota bacterium]|nr:MFS transporter [Chloroflexota bacterium]